jgi:AsmA protein
VNRGLKITLILAAVVVVAILSLPLIVNADQFRPKLESELTSALGRKVTLGDLSFSVFSGTLTAKDLSIADDERFSSTPFTRAKSLVLSVDLWPFLFSHRLTVTGLSITEPQIALTQNDAGEWNFSTARSRTGSSQPASSSGPAPLSLSVKLVNITNGMLTIGRTGNQTRPTVLSNVNITVRDFAPNARFPFELSAQLAPHGDIKLTGQAGPINAADASATPVNVNLKISGVDLSATGITAGTGVAGLLSIDGDANLAGPSVDWKGLVHLDQPRFVSNGQAAKVPVEFDFTVHHDLQKHTGQLISGQIHLGNAPASLTGAYAEQGNATAVDLRLAGSGMPVGELAKLLPSLGVELPAGSSLQGGTATINASVTGATTAPLIAGTAGLSNTMLKGFDLDAKVAFAEKLAGIRPSPDTEIQTLSVAFRTDNGNTTISNLTFVVPAVGNLDGVGSVDQKKNLNFNMRATVNTQGPFATVLGHGLGTTFPFFIHGTASNPSFEPDVKGIALGEINRLKDAKIGGIGAGSATSALQSLFGGKK